MDKAKVLIIDDEPDFTEMVKLNLEATEKYHVKVENDARHALFSALEYLPDIILLDIIMPDMEGPDVVGQLRDNHLLEKIPIVFLTATVTHDEVISQNGHIGGYDFLAKPTSVEELIECIDRHVGRPS